MVQDFDICHLKLTKVVWWKKKRNRYPQTSTVIYITSFFNLQVYADASLWRFLRAFQDVDAAYEALVKCYKWRQEYGVDQLSEDDEDIQIELKSGKAVLLPDADQEGR